MTMNTSGISLERCPFCGHSAVMKKEGLRRFGPCTYWVQCPMCRCETAPWGTKEQAAAHWNRRELDA